MPTTNYKLNPKQTQILLLTYKFRFITTSLLAEYKQTSTLWTIQKSLTVLVKQGYLYRRYEKHYKIDRLPALYFLTPKAMQQLKGNPELNSKVLHARYKDRYLQQSTIDHHLLVFQTYLDIKQQHPDRFTIFTKYELWGYDHLPDPLPDLYLTQDKGTDIMVDIYTTSTQPYLIRKRIDQLIKHYEDSSDQDSYPDIQIIVPTKYIEESLNRYIEKKKDERYIDDSELIINASLEIK